MATSPSGQTHDIVVVGASAGGVQALKRLAAGLPADFPGSLFVVLHTAPDSPGLMPSILERSGPLPVRHPQDAEVFERGRIYVAPPDRHMVLREGHIHLPRGPSENNSRPSVNPLFRSAARTYGPRVVGVILTGALDDGTAGLIAVEERNGVSIVQDPQDADFAGMPRHALEFVDVDYVLPLAKIAPCLAMLARRPVTPAPVMEITPPAEDVELPENGALGISCPECHGSLWKVGDGEMPEYRCRIGHIYSSESLAYYLGTRSLEELDSAYRALEEEATTAEKMFERALARNASAGRARRYRRRAEAARARANAVLEAMQLPPAPPPEPGG